ncbi:hypothetical protein KCU93_g9445, partial [Aureobasidium melanogenum]
MAGTRAEGGGNAPYWAGLSSQNCRHFWLFQARDNHGSHAEPVRVCARPKTWFKVVARERICSTSPITNIFRIRSLQRDARPAMGEPAAATPSTNTTTSRPATSRLAALGSSPEKGAALSTDPSSSSATGYYTAPEPETPTPALGRQNVPPAYSFQPPSSAHGRQLFPPPQAAPYFPSARGTLAQGQHAPQPAPGRSNASPASNQGHALALSAVGGANVSQTSASRFHTAAQVPQFPNLMYPPNLLARRGSPGLYGPSGLQRSHSPKRTSSPDSSETQRARRSSSQIGDTAICCICRNHRPVHIVNAENVCEYCNSGAAEHESRYCPSCRVMRDGNDFLADGPDCICTFCLNPPSLTSEDWSERLASTRRRSRSSSVSSTSSIASTALRRTSNLTNEGDPGFSPNVQQLSDADFDRAEMFRDAMNWLSRETCSTCNRAWFDSNIVNSSCLVCRGKDVKSAIPFYSGANYLSVGSTPNLPKLSIIEEMSIARVSAMLEVWSVQQGSAGRVTSYLREEARVYSVLPIPIQEVGVVVVAPSNGTNINRQFLDHTLYRRDSVRIWLEFLIQNHPGYRGVTINHHALDQLMPQIHGLNKLPTETKQGTINVSLPITPPVRTAKPTLLSLHTFAPSDPLQSQTYETVPIVDMNTKRPCLSWMFPTLYPTGQAEFCRPRPRSIPFAEYLSHLIRQEDARFIQHPQWLYASFNLLLSQQIQGRTRYLASKLPKALNLLDIEQAIAQGDQSPILKYLVNDMRVLRGTRPYWQMRTRELKAQAAALGDPNLFLTLSADNGGWDSLRRLLPGLSASSSYVAIREAIVANPHIVLHHFMQRQQTFMETIFRPKFDVTDWWTRFEYQANGAVHLHAFSWNNGTPPFVPMAQTDTDIQAHVNRNQPLAVFWDPHITAMNPQNVIPQAELSRMINRFQIHQHTIKCATQDGSCRIGFPRPLATQAEIGLSHSNRVVFNPRRDDPMLNQYSRVVSYAWNANTDIQPMIDGERALEYATKDAVVASDHSGHELSTIANITSPQIRLAASVASHVADQKEYHGQEICHQLLGHGLTESSRGTVIVDCRRVEDQSEVAGKSLMKRYIERRAGTNHLTLLDFATKYDFAKDMAPITRQRVPVFIPKFDARNETEDYARAKLMLRHPFSRSVDELLTIASPNLQPFPNFTAAWQYCRTSHAHDVPFDTLDARSATQSHEQDVAVDQDWSLLLGRLQQESFEIHLGKRDMDKAYVWPVNTHQVDTTFWSKMIQRPLLPANLVAPDAVNLLNGEQLNVHRKVMGHFQTAFNSDTYVEPFRVQVDGPAGSGKTFMINTISFHLESLAHHMKKPNPVLRVSPTAAAAFGISGQTIHSAFEIRVGRQFAPLDDATCKRLRDDYASVHLIVIDEKSMIDLRLLHQIDLRCQQIWNNKRPFGDMCVLLTGDFAQLPPVIGKPLYATHELTLEETRFQTIYRGFDKTVRLTRIIRQSGDMRLQTILNELRNNAVSDRSCDLLASRCMSLLSTREIHDFDEAVRIYNTNAQVNQYNVSRLRSAGAPVLRIDATGKGQDWSRAPDDAAGGLENALFVSIGTRVMLTNNLSTSTGAKNGATGVVRHIAFAANKTPRVDMPSAILVELDKYTGPTMDIDGRQVVPIFPVTRTYHYNGHHCSRTQFPLAVAYAMTVHASQGATITGKAVYDISRRDWVHGLTYTSLSRVTTLDSMMLELPFGRELFATTVAEKKESSYIRQRKLDELRRANQPW